MIALKKPPTYIPYKVPTAGYRDPTPKLPSFGAPTRIPSEGRNTNTLPTGSSQIPVGTTTADFFKQQLENEFSMQGKNGGQLLQTQQQQQVAPNEPASPIQQKLPNVSLPGVEGLTDVEQAWAKFMTQATPPGLGSDFTSLVSKIFQGY